jgi:hypothetical protein
MAPKPTYFTEEPPYVDWEEACSGSTRKTVAGTGSAIERPGGIRGKGRRGGDTKHGDTNNCACTAVSVSGHGFSRALKFVDFQPSPQGPQGTGHAPLKGRNGVWTFAGVARLGVRRLDAAFAQSDVGLPGGGRKDRR